MDAKQLREYIVRPALQLIELHSDDAENLVMGTAAQESRLMYIHQLGKGPALSLFQMEPATHDDIWEHYLAYQPALTERVFAATYVKSKPDSSRLLWDLRYSAIMCRIHYRRKPGAIPDNLNGWAAYWKKHYNTPLGAGTVEEFVHNYELVV